MKWKLLSSEYLTKHRYFTARRDRCEMLNGHIVDPYFVVELPSSACALAITEEGKVIIARQYRHPIGEVISEIPGGFIDENEDPGHAIGRELMEETGYTFPDIKYLGRVAANPGVLTGYTYLYLARGGKKINDQKLDDNEEIEVSLVSLDELRKMMDNNEI